MNKCFSFLSSSYVVSALQTNVLFLEGIPIEYIPRYITADYSLITFMYRTK